MVAADKNDGYYGHLGEEMSHPKIQKEHFKAFPLKLPAGKRTTLAIKQVGGVFYWRCTTCNESIATEKWERPLHECKKEESCDSTQGS